MTKNVKLLCLQANEGLKMINNDLRSPYSRNKIKDL